ncbi:MAG: GAF domain-containing protein, partial [Planctomycetota bacterium]
MPEAARARRYLLDGDCVAALGVCEAALAEEPSPEEALGLRVVAARAARGSGDLLAAREHLEAAEALARARRLDALGPLLAQLGEVQLALDRPGEAAATLEEALERIDARDELRPRAREALVEARRREAEGEDEDEDEDEGEAPPAPARKGAAAATPPTSELAADLAHTAGAQRLFAMTRRLLEADTDLSLPGLLDLVLAELVVAVEADRGFVLLREPGEGLVVRAARDARGRDLPDPARLVSRRIAERAAAESRPLRAVRPAEDPRFSDSRSARALDLQAVVAAPLRYRRLDLGSVVLDRSGRSVPPFGDEAEALVAHFAKLVSGLIVRTRRRDAERRRLRALEDLFARGVRQLGERFDTAGFVGESQAAFDLLRLLERAAPNDARVLVRGESGTGKELVARMLHRNSPRAEGPFCAVNCAALTESLLEAELFGHAQGAFTGADRDRPGLFERAHEGTLFLDEVGDASPRLQAELLRVLQEGEVRRIGEATPRQVDVRVVAATHQDLEGLVAQGLFREDLLYRLNVLEVRVPPLRERREDIPLLAQAFAQEARELLADPERAHGLDAEALAELQRRDWPGNVRELRNAVQRLVTLGSLPPAAQSPE